MAPVFCFLSSLHQLCFKEETTRNHWLSHVEVTLYAFFLPVFLLDWLWSIRAIFASPVAPFLLVCLFCLIVFSKIRKKDFQVQNCTEISYFFNTGTLWLFIKLKGKAQLLYYKSEVHIFRIKFCFESQIEKGSWCAGFKSHLSLITALTFNHSRSVLLHTVSASFSICCSLSCSSNYFFTCLIMGFSVSLWILDSTQQIRILKIQTCRCGFLICLSVRSLHRLSTISFLLEQLKCSSWSSRQKYVTF